jgi:hypothetical protein
MKECGFRNLDHRLGAMKVHSRGEALAVGYRPDLTATQDGALRLIIENEPRTDLKAAIGCYQRAEKFCRDIKASPSLIIVMAQTGRIDFHLAADRLRDFAQFWKGVNSPGGVREVLVLSDLVYSETVRRRIPLLSAEFRDLCRTISPGEPAVPAPPASTDEPSPARRQDPATQRGRGEVMGMTA